MIRVPAGVALLLLALFPSSAAGVERPQPPAPEPPSIERAIVDPTAKASEISTEELRRILEEGSAMVLDTRPYAEYAVSHIPGARNAAAKPGVAMAEYVSDVAAIGRMVGGRTSAPLVLYCNGPFCGKSRRLAEELRAAGFTNVRRYQLGIPVWRALGGVTQIEAEGFRHVLSLDRTAVVIDARDPGLFRAGSLPGARNVPRSGLLPGKDAGVILEAKNDGRLPMEDHNTRLLVVGDDASQARAVAEALAREAFHNVSFFGGTYDEARAAAAPR